MLILQDYLLKGGYPEVFKFDSLGGSYTVLDSKGACPLEKLEPEWCFKPYDDSLIGRICEVWLDEKMNVRTEWMKVKPIPTSEG